MATSSINSAAQGGSRPVVNGTGHQQRSGDLAGGSGQVGGFSSQNLNGILDASKRNRKDADDHRKVLEYLSKKGFNKTEWMLRKEIGDPTNEPIPYTLSTQDKDAENCGIAFKHLRDWIEEGLQIYKADLRRILWPVFVYTFLKIASESVPPHAQNFFAQFQEIFETEHSDDLRALKSISLPQHVESSQIAGIYKSAKYRLRVNEAAFMALIMFLESQAKYGGLLLVSIIQTHINVITYESSTSDQHSLAHLLNRAKVAEDFPAEDEGIPGHNPGSANTEQAANSTVLTKLRLGPMPMEEDLKEDLRAELDESDVKMPPNEGRLALAEHFEQQIKQEEGEEAPSRQEIPLPPSTARDVAMEVQKVKENRDRFKIEGRTGGLPVPVSVVMYTFHNTYDSINCLDFSQDNTLVAAGTQESYIRVWSLDGKPLPGVVESTITESREYSSRRLIGHSKPVYAVSFSPSASGIRPTHLLSSSGDKSVILWSLDTYSPLVVYKGHDDIVWDVKWGPYGHYFLTGAHDRTARLWATSHIGYLRIFAGHDQDVDVVCFHPNSVYVFTGSSDKTVRMWAVSNGYPVRMFTGHAGNITSMTCSPSGKVLATADDSGTIILWDLALGRLLKRMRGHAKGGIWSLSWSVESTILVSAGADGTVRTWDVAVGNDAPGQGKVIGDGGTGQKIDGSAGKKKGKDVVVTSDQISAFPTKKSPVYKVQFTRQNLVLAGGAYLP